MKLIKLIVIVLMLTVSASYAMENPIIDEMTQQMSDVVAEAKAGAPEQIQMQEATAREKFISLLANFISSGFMAFLIYLVCPKFAKTTGDILMERNKFRIIFEGIKICFIMTIFSILGLFLLIGMYPAVFLATMMLGLYFIGLPMFSIGIMEWLFTIKGLTFDKLTKVNKLISMVSINLLLFIIVLPFALVVPGYSIDAGEGNVFSIDIFSNLIVFIMTISGVGMTAIRLTELFEKHRKKL